MDKTLLSAIIGSILGFLATLISGLIARLIQRRNIEKSFRIALKLELKDSLKTLDEFKKARDRQNNMYDFVLIGLLDANVSNLQSARRKIYLLKDQEKQAEAYGVINKLSVLATEIRGTQNYEYEDLKPPVTQEGKDQFIKDKKGQHSLQLIEISKDISDLVKSIKI